MHVFNKILFALKCEYLWNNNSDIFLELEFTWDDENTMIMEISFLRSKTLIVIILRCLLTKISNLYSFFFFFFYEITIHFLLSLLSLTLRD